MKLTLTMDMNNAAFEEYNTNEVTRVLQTLASKISAYGSLKPGDSFALTDINGNDIGLAEVKD